ncbi:MAG: hypothetical protein WCH39_11485 [Schlesneria sp.]
MRMITGALLLLVAELAFYHAHSIGFPHYRFVNEVLLPVSGLLAIMGVGMIGFGLWFDRPPPPPPPRPPEV